MMSPDISQLRFDFVHFSMVRNSAVNMHFGVMIFNLFFRVSRIDGRAIVMVTYSRCSAALVANLNFADKIMANTVSWRVQYQVAIWY